MKQQSTRNVKYFVSSDIHSFFTEWRNALHRAGFEEDNPDHHVIVCGDLFDRGLETVCCYDFVMKMLQQGRCVYIRGNHEDLMEALIMCVSRRRDIGRHHITNGTLMSLAELTGHIDYDILCGVIDWAKFDSGVAKITELFSHCVDYFEVGNYIFVHGWIPCKAVHTNSSYFRVDDKYEYDPAWINATTEDWDKARWINGMAAHHDGVVVPNKTIVCGHWHTSFGHANLEENNGTEWGPDANFEPYIKNGIIALDACTARTKTCNIYVIEENRDEGT